ncbi:MAG: type II toxin-antitoxin system HicA family toxin [Deltaproteobacteria bacterium]|nr:type II toxin-antitoxin system HicA family toxin [Deltaproteobacteria bacterium]MBM4293538.1 type II toxin-antitoxin system HicA family toxin [Deltaproteobacteria bacterium]
MNRRQLLKRLAQGHLHNVPFSDLISLVEGFGFKLQRMMGSHHIFGHPGIAELINLQDVGMESFRFNFTLDILYFFS